MNHIKYYIKKYELLKYKYCLLLIPLIIVLILIIPKNEPIMTTTPTPTLENEIQTIKIDIKGEVVNPGIYELKANSRVIDAINESGGFTEKSDTTVINLSKILHDEDVIIIYSKQEIEVMTSGETSVKIIETECYCPELPENIACIEEPITETEDNSKISLNKATLEQLMTLSGIGESKAKAIITYREENGNFKTIEEIMEVSGIGDATFQKIKNNITI